MEALDTCEFIEEIGCFPPPEPTTEPRGPKRQSTPRKAVARHEMPSRSNSLGATLPLRCLVCNSWDQVDLNPKSKIPRTCQDCRAFWEHWSVAKFTHKQPLPRCISGKEEGCEITMENRDCVPCRWKKYLDIRRIARLNNPAYCHEIVRTRLSTGSLRHSIKSPPSVISPAPSKPKRKSKANSPNNIGKCLVCSERIDHQWSHNASICPACNTFRYIGHERNFECITGRKDCIIDEYRACNHCLWEKCKKLGLDTEVNSKWEKPSGTFVGTGRSGAELSSGPRDVERVTATQNTNKIPKHKTCSKPSMCQICGSRGGGIRLFRKIICCCVCRVFVSSQKNPELLKCTKRSGRCHIDKNTRTKCPYCRYKKFLAARSAIKHTVSPSGSNSHIGSECSTIEETKPDSISMPVGEEIVAEASNQGKTDAVVRGSELKHQLPDKVESCQVCGSSVSVSLFHEIFYCCRACYIFVGTVMEDGLGSLNCIDGSNNCRIEILDQDRRCGYCLVQKFLILGFNADQEMLAREKPNFSNQIDFEETTIGAETSYYPSLQTTNNALSSTSMTFGQTRKCLTKKSNSCRLCGSMHKRDKFRFILDTCRPCRRFIARYIGKHNQLRCVNSNGKCLEYQAGGTKCRYCRYQKYLDLTRHLLEEVLSEAIKSGRAVEVKSESIQENSALSSSIVDQTIAAEVGVAQIASCENAIEQFRLDSSLLKRIKYECQICGSSDKVWLLKEVVYCCNTCYVFQHKLSKRKDTNLLIVCANENGRCEINYENRAQCTFCRYKKFLDCGLNPHPQLIELDMTRNLMIIRKTTATRPSDALASEIRQSLIEPSEYYDSDQSTVIIELD